ncbi:MAG: hypothetical protein M3R40_05315, partial [Pseudomonadota bacterium]|nr:hypothetical protein [Pseudomonadota bacterium]
MSIAAQPLTNDEAPPAPWWIRGMLIVMAIGFIGLIAITLVAYRGAPPIPAQVVDAHGVNFPFDPSVGNQPTPGAVLWRALGLVVLLAGIASVLLAFERFDYLGWITRSHHVHPQLLPGQASRGQDALVKFFVVVALLFLAQTLVGGAIAHYRADPGSFYGFDLARIFPRNLMRVGHLQTAIFWIATSYVAAALFLGRSLRTDEPRWFARWVHVLLAAFAVVIGGSLLGEWLGISQRFGLAMMVAMSLFPGGVLQVWDVVQHGYWHARSLDYIGS